MIPATAPGVIDLPLRLDLLQGDLFQRNPALRPVPAGKQPCFVNAFAGCGGFALGLLRSGWRGVLAIEDRKAVWETFSGNLLQRSPGFDWPEDIECQPWSLGSLLATRRGALASLAGSVDLLAAAVPCASRTAPEDPGNRTWQDFLTLTEILRPALIAIESGPAFARPPSQPECCRMSFAEHFQDSLPGYDVTAAMLDAEAFGVPQRRRRVWVVAARNDLGLPVHLADFFDRLGRSAPTFLDARERPRSPTAEDAIGDLETLDEPAVADGGEETHSPAYGGPRSAFQASMRQGYDGEPSDRRLTRHSSAVQAQYGAMIARARQLDGARKTGGKRKTPGRRPTRVLLSAHPAPPVPARPEDLLHYSEPRTLTVREAARLQTFPDDFTFCGVHTASGARRKFVMPRYAQVAMATPPLLSEQIGVSLRRLYRPWAGDDSAACRQAAQCESCNS